MGHGMQSLTEKLIKDWHGGTVILSPVNIPKGRLYSYAKRVHNIGGSVLFDPQLFYPKDGHTKLKEYDYWPLEGVSISESDTNKKICNELLRINNNINSSAIILPSIEIKEDKFAYSINHMENYAKFFSSKSDKPLYATICLYSETIRNNQAIEFLVEYLRTLPVDGFYIIPQPANGEYIVSDPLWVVGMLKLITCLKLSKKFVITGYTNHQGLLYSIAGADVIASGNFMNTRSFNPSKFKSHKDDIKQKSTWYYLPSAFCEYKAALLDIAQSRGFLDLFQTNGNFNNEYSSMLFKGARPSSTNYDERNSFLHYLHCLKTQCELLTKKTYMDTYCTYEFLLSSAEKKMKDIKKFGMTGQNRDFSPAIETNRIAMCANNQDYGLKLRLDWNEIKH